MLLVCTLAFGTLGDVLPLLALSQSLIREQAAPPLQLTFLTHRAHQALLEGPLDRAGFKASWIDSLPAREWHGRKAGKRKSPKDDCDGSGTQLSWADEESHRDACVSACEHALGLQAPGWDPQQRPGQDGARSLASMGQSGGEGSPSRLIVFNLFALEGFHIAEALGVPCVAASPCLVPYAMPASFERGFQKAHLELYEALQAARAAPGEQSGGAKVSWDEVRHWMWPLFTMRWGPWRYHRLGIPEVPYCYKLHQLPPPPPLLYGLSPLVIPRPGFWPEASVHLCGFWHSLGTFPPEGQRLPAQVTQIHKASAAPMEASASLQIWHGKGLQILDGSLSAAAAAEEAAAPTKSAAAAAAAVTHVAAPVCVDFGSMGAMGLVSQPARLLRVLASAAELLQCRFIVLAGGWPRLTEQAPSLSDLTSSALLLVLNSPVAHDVLLPHCAALLHHGGSGTVAAALRCGVPQLVCPLHFDQHSWAERVSWMGCGAQLPTSVLFPPAGSVTAAAPPPPAAEGGDEGGQGQEIKATQEELRAAEALAAALRPLLEEGSEIRDACQGMQQALAGEDGTAVAVQHILRYLQQYRRYQKQDEQTQMEQQQQQQQQQQHVLGKEGGATPATTPASLGCPSTGRGMPTKDAGIVTAASTASAGPSAATPALAAGSDAKQHQRAELQQPPPQQRQQQEDYRRPQQPAVSLTLPNGLAICCLSRSEALLIYEEVWERRCYLRHGIRVPPAGVVLDVGANIGLFSLHVLQEAAARGGAPAAPAAGEERADDSRGYWDSSPSALAQQQDALEAGRGVTWGGEPAQREALPTTAAASACRAGPVSLRVFAFEPVPQIAEVLQQNIAAFGLSNMVTALPQAFYSRCTSLPITYYPCMPGNSTAKPAEKWAHQRPHMAPGAATTAFQGAQQMSCQATTLAAFAREQGLPSIDLLKVDVEGCELEVLQGMDDHCWAITHQVVLEVSHAEGRLEAIQQLLRQHSFRVVVEDDHLGGNSLVHALRAAELS